MTTTTPRVCVTCDQPIELGEYGVTTYVHSRAISGETAPDHPAQPKLAHPMDTDPFAGLDDSED